MKKRLFSTALALLMLAALLPAQVVGAEDTETGGMAISEQSGESTPSSRGTISPPDATVIAARVYEDPQEVDVTDGMYSFDGFAEGHYSISAKKEGYVSYEQPDFYFTEGSELPSIELVKVGKINGGSGDVSVTDLACLFEYLSTGSYTGAITDWNYIQAVADVNGDGEQNILDYQQLYDTIRRTVTEVEYDGNVRVVKKSYYNADGIIEKCVIYRYNEDGNEFYRSEIKYDGAGREKRTEYYWDGKLSEYTVFEYDDANGQKTATNYTAGGIRKTVIQYDAEDRIVKYTDYKEDGIAVSYTVVNEYMDDGSLVRTETYDNGSKVVLLYEETNVGMLREVKRTEYINGVMQSYSIPEYNASGREKKRTYYNPDGTIQSYYEREYLENGMVRQTEYDAAGNVTRVLELAIGPSTG